MQLYANPYVGAGGFYFSSPEEWRDKYAKALRRGIEEFEIDFIDGSHEEADLAKAFSVNQANVEQFFELIETAPEEDYAAIFYALERLSYDADKAVRWADREGRPFKGDVEEFAEHLLEDGVMPSDPESYFDFDAFGGWIRDDVVNSAVEDARYQAQQDGEDPDAAEEGMREDYERMSDYQLGEQYVDFVYGDVGRMEDKTRERFFDTEKFARDLELGGDVNTFEFAGHTYTIWAA